jgi:hypothetical protein
MAKRERKENFGVGTLPPLPPLPRIYNTHGEGIGLLFRELQDESTDAIAAYATGYIQELAGRVQLLCSDVKLTSQEKQRECILLFFVACDAAKILQELAKAFPEQFRGIAEIMPGFPCMFPAHPDKLKSLKDEMWDTLNLGRRHTLKLRPSRGRKTFSFETWVNKLLIHYIFELYRTASNQVVEDILINGNSATPLRALFPAAFTADNAKQWLDAIWKLLFIDIPEPEKHPELRKLGQHPSRTERAHFGERKTTRSIKDAVEKNAKHQTAGYVRAAIKEALGKYLVRMLRKEQLDK